MNAVVIRFGITPLPFVEGIMRHESGGEDSSTRNPDVIMRKRKHGRFR